MSLKILAPIITLLIAGIGLTLYLPKYQTTVPTNNKPLYTIDQDSLSTPLPMEDFLLKVPTPPDALFTLRLGLYSQLKQAVNAIKSAPLAINCQIVKTTDGTRMWYLVLIGQYQSINQAEQQKQWLQNNQISSTLMLLPVPQTK